MDVRIQRTTQSSRSDCTLTQRRILNAFRDDRETDALDSIGAQCKVTDGNGRCNAVRKKLLGHLPLGAGFRPNAQSEAVPLLNQGLLLILRET